LEYLTKISDYLKSLDEDVVRTDSGEIAFPIVLENGDEEFITVKISIPSGSRGDGGYNGYAVAESYRITAAQRAEKAENARKAKEEKIAKAKARKENSAKIKAEKEKREKEEKGE
jgi:hypothetical protein